MENVTARWWGLYACCEDSSGKGSGGSKVMSGKQVAWVVGLESENVDTGIGSARGSGERRWMCIWRALRFGKCLGDVEEVVGIALVQNCILLLVMGRL